MFALGPLPCTNMYMYPPPPPYRIVTKGILQIVGSYYSNFQRPPLLKLAIDSYMHIVINRNYWVSCAVSIPHNEADQLLRKLP